MPVMKHLIFIYIFGLLTTAQAQNIYKSIDEQGNITYSSSVPDQQGNVEVLPPTSEPTPEAVQAARRQQEELVQSLKESEAKREKAKQQRQQTQPEKKVNTVVERQYIPYPVNPTRRYIRPKNLPATRPINRPR